jgi:hypothetical protein
MDTVERCNDDARCSEKYSLLASGRQSMWRAQAVRQLLRHTIARNSAGGILESHRMHRFY